MKYQSTRGAAKTVSASEAILYGLAEDGGLYVPEQFPAVSPEMLLAWSSLSYPALAAKIMALYLSDFSEEELQDICTKAYGDRFDNTQIAPLVALKKNEQILELFHGPTLAFKDMALQILPYLLTASMKKQQESKKVLILVATSGDTGKAAMEGFADVENTAIHVFYPHGGVSPAQELQMRCQKGKNIALHAVKGNFDDTQTGVKRIFSDVDFAKEIDAEGYRFSSANSMNFGRLLPQIVYYFSAYFQAVHAGAIQMGDVLNFVVPTGNFGNILSGYYAKQMGLPVGRLICASNRNNVLTDFFADGIYDRKRTFYQTSSPSMDILVSSNLERLLYEISQRDTAQVASWMEELNHAGKYQLSPAQRETVLKDFAAGYADDEQVKQTIAKVWNENNMLLDTHSAVAQCVLDHYIENSHDETATVLVSTASPYKFAADVLAAIAPEKLQKIDSSDPFAVTDLLEEATHIPVPEGIESLRKANVAKENVIERDEMKKAVLASVQQWKQQS